ncbi:uncharacterized protein LOC118734257 [Rhagoletis pomonella]|uniref:uncharacterized protein LOC118734257 n=1 Tax=Rhagoletis pomonella TaxID=28610 RepID=UPI001785167D|nr:uncharacterized protein LOC118734257 [Rhagoletis pomonella]
MTARTTTIGAFYGTCLDLSKQLTTANRPPLQIFDFEDNIILKSYNFKVNSTMATVATIPSYNRQQSTDSGWDNPFRPGGDLSREADEIVNMIRETFIHGNGGDEGEYIAAPQSCFQFANSRM